MHQDWPNYRQKLELYAGKWDLKLTKIFKSDLFSIFSTKFGAFTIFCPREKVQDSLLAASPPPRGLFDVWLGADFSSIHRKF